MNRSQEQRIDKAPQFEFYLAELQQIVVELESGNVSLADSLQKYETGIKHLKSCYELLANAEKRVEILSGIDSDGNAVVEPFDENTDSLETKARTRSQRRSRKEPKEAEKTALRDQQSDIDDTPTLF